MNILQQQDALKGLPDQALQKELLNPSGAAPSFLVLTELQRRKDLRASYAGMQRNPQTSMAEEFVQGLGSADAGSYPQAVRGAMPPSPMGEQPAPPQSFASGGIVPIMATPGLGANTQIAPIGAPAMDPGAGMAGGMPGGTTSTGTSTTEPPGLAAVAPMYFAGIPPMQAAMMLDGSADGATGNDGVGGSGVGGTGGVGGSASAGTGESGVGGEAASGGLVRRNGTVRRYQKGGEVEGPDDWMWPSVARYRQRVLGLPPEPSSRPDWSGGKAPNIRLPNWALPSPEPVWPPQMETPRRGLGIQGGLYPPQPADYPPVYVPQPGVSPGQSIANDIRGVSPELIPSRTGETGGLPMVDRAVPGGAGFGGPEPMLPPGPLSDVYPNPTEAGGIGQAIQGGPNGQMDGISQNPGVPMGPPPPPVGGPGGGGGGPAGGPRSADLNIGGEGLESYWREVQSLRLPNRLAEMAARNQQDRDRLDSSKNTDVGLALLAAGLKIAGGKSRYAAENIGEGGLEGLKQWNESSKERRQIERDIRRADDQIAIAQAARDDGMLQKAMALKAAAETKKMQAEEMRQRAQIASEDRRSKEATSSADRQTQMDINRERLASEDRNRTENREQHEIDSHLKSYQTVTTQLDRMLIARQEAMAKVQMNESGARDSLDAINEQIRSLERKQNSSHDMYQEALIRREVKAKRIVELKSKEDYEKLPSGTKYLDTDGKLKVKK